MSDFERSHHDYYTAVSDAADELLKEAREHDDPQDDDEAFECANERAFEYVENLDWIIYTHHAASVLWHSSNEDAIFEAMGEEQTFSSWADAQTKMLNFLGREV